MNRCWWMAPMAAALASFVAGCGARSDLGVGATGDVVSPPTLASPWPMRGHDPANRGRGASPVIADPVELWSFPVLDSTGAVSFASPAIAGDGTLYLQLGNSGTLIAVNPDGTLKWKVEHVAANGASAESSPALGADGTIYIGAGSQLAALDPDGEILWTLPTSSDVRGSPVVTADGSIDFGDDTGHLYSASAKGALLWSLALPGGADLVDLTPAAAPDGTVYAALGKTLFAVVKGSLLWSANLDGVGAGSPRPPSIADDGTIVVVDDVRMFAFRPDSSAKWVFEAGASGEVYLASSAVISADGTTCVSMNLDSASAGSVVAIGADGVFKWSVKTAFSAGPMAPTAASDGNVYTTDPVQIVDPTGLVTATKIPQAQAITPIVIGANGTFYTVFDGALHAFGR